MPPGYKEGVRMGVIFWGDFCGLDVYEIRLTFFFFVRSENTTFRLPMGYDGTCTNIGEGGVCGQRRDRPGAMVA